MTIAIATATIEQVKPVVPIPLDDGAFILDEDRAIDPSNEVMLLVEFKYSPNGCARYLLINGMEILHVKSIDRDAGWQVESTKVVNNNVILRLACHNTNPRWAKQPMRHGWGNPPTYQVFRIKTKPHRIMPTSRQIREAIGSMSK